MTDPKTAVESRLQIPSAKMSSRRRGFTLLELLTVIAIIALMAGLIVPSISNGISGRSGAPGLVMNTVEQARAAALQGMGETHLVFSQAAFPNHDAMMILRIRGDDGKPEALTGWIPLPRGVILHSLPAIPECGLNGNLTEAHEAWAAWQQLPLGIRSRPGRLSILTFNSSGAPKDAGNGDILLVLADGHRDAIGPDAILKTPGGDAGIFDVVAVACFSGRPYYFTARQGDLANSSEAP